MTSSIEIFYYFVVLMLAAAIWLLARPLSRTPKSNYIENKQVNLDIYKQHVAELQADLDNALISQDEFNAAQNDLEKQLINDVPEQEDNKAKEKSASKNDLIAIFFFIPAIAVGIYFSLGNPDTMRLGTTATNTTSPHASKAVPETKAPSVSEVIVNVEQRLAKDPDNIKDLRLLSRSYLATKQFAKAEPVFAKLTTLVTNDPDLWAEYADVKGVLQQGSLAGEPVQFLNKALALNPNHLKSLWLMGTHYYRQEQYQQAVDSWQKLYSLLDPATKIAQTIQVGINQAQQKLGVAQTPAAEATGKSMPASTASISGSVALDPALAKSAKPTDTVFVYARAASGPPMPLAVVRKQVKDLPFEFTLDDSMAMMPQMKLSSFEKVVVTARISSTGNAITSSGDLISKKNEVTNSHPMKLNLIINSVVE